MTENTNANNKPQPKSIHPQKTTKLQNKDDEYYDEDEDYEQNYENEFEQNLTNQGQKSSKDTSKPHEAKQLDQYRKDFEAEEEEQPLYVKEDSPHKKKANINKKKTQQSKKDIEQKNNKKKKDKKETVPYKPEKRILQEIKQLLTYRMKAQRYPYEELKRDI